MTYTKGPWTVGNRYGNLHTEIAAPGYTKAICYCWTHLEAPKAKDDRKRVFVADPEGEANARLLASAPELIDQLQAMLRLVDGLPWHVRDSVYREFNERTGGLPGNLPQPIADSRSLVARING